MKRRPTSSHTLISVTSAGPRGKACPITISVCHGVRFEILDESGKRAEICAVSVALYETPVHHIWPIVIICRELCCQTCHLTHFLDEKNFFFFLMSIFIFGGQMNPLKVF